MVAEGSDNTEGQSGPAAPLRCQRGGEAPSKMPPWVGAVAAQGGRWLQVRDSRAAQGQRELPLPRRLR